MTTIKPTPSTAAETGERWLLSELAALVRLLREDFDAVYSPVAALHLTQTADSLLADYDAVANTVNSHAELERERDALKAAARDALVVVELHAPQMRHPSNRAKYMEIARKVRAALGETK